MTYKSKRYEISTGLFCPPVTLNNTQLSQSESAKYLGIHLDIGKNITLRSGSELIAIFYVFVIRTAIHGKLSNKVYTFHLNCL